MAMSALDDVTAKLGTREFITDAEIRAVIAELQATIQELRDEVERLEDENRSLAKAVYQ
jgi:uncharacterized small protein (DUF1192 family)